MNYESYELINALLNAQVERIKGEWVIAVAHFDGVRGKQFDAAHAKVQERFRAIHEARAELRELVREHYKDHPNQALREFWGNM